MFGSAPDLDVAFENEEDREAARNFMDLLAASESGGYNEYVLGLVSFVSPVYICHPSPSMRPIGGVGKGLPSEVARWIQ